MDTDTQEISQEAADLWVQARTARVAAQFSASRSSAPELRAHLDAASDAEARAWRALAQTEAR